MQCSRCASHLDLSPAGRSTLPVGGQGQCGQLGQARRDTAHPVSVCDRSPQVTTRTVLTLPLTVHGPRRGFSSDCPGGLTSTPPSDRTTPDGGVAAGAGSGDPRWLRRPATGRRGPGRAQLVHRSGGEGVGTPAAGVRPLLRYARSSWTKLYPMPSGRDRPQWQTSIFLPSPATWTVLPEYPRGVPS